MSAVGPEQADDIVIGLDRIVIAAEAQIDRRQDLPALAVVRIGGEVRLDAGDKRRECPAVSVGAVSRAASGSAGISGEPTKR